MNLPANILKVKPDPQVQKFILDLITGAIEAGEHEYLMNAGVPAELLDELRELKSYELTRLIQRDLNFSLVLDSVALSHQIHVLKLQLDEQRTREFFIGRGCPTPLAARLFRMGKRDVLAMRLSLGTPKPMMSLKPSLKPVVEDAWLRCRPANFCWWAPLTTESVKAEVRSWQVLLAEFPELNLLTLYQIVMRFERFDVAEEKQA